MPCHVCHDLSHCHEPAWAISGREPCQLHQQIKGRVPPGCLEGGVSLMWVPAQCLVHPRGRGQTPSTTTPQSLPPPPPPPPPTPPPTGKFGGGGGRGGPPGGGKPPPPPSRRRFRGAGGGRGSPAGRASPTPLPPAFTTHPCLPAAARLSTCLASLHSHYGMAGGRGDQCWGSVRQGGQHQPGPIRGGKGGPEGEGGQRGGVPCPPS